MFTLNPWFLIKLLIVFLYILFSSEGKKQQQSIIAKINIFFSHNLDKKYLCDDFEIKGYLTKKQGDQISVSELVLKARDKT